MYYLILIENFYSILFHSILYLNLRFCHGHNVMKSWRDHRSTSGEWKKRWKSGGDCVIGVKLGLLMVTEDDRRGERDGSGGWGYAGVVWGVRWLGDHGVVRTAVVFAHPFCPLIVRQVWSFPMFCCFFGFGSTVGGDRPEIVRYMVWDSIPADVKILKVHTCKRVSSCLKTLKIYLRTWNLIPANTKTWRSHKKY